MRFIRVAALIGSLILIVGSLVGLVTRRAALQQDAVNRRERDAQSAAMTIEAAVARAAAALGAAGDAPLVDLERLAGLAGEEVTVCEVRADVRRCGGPRKDEIDGRTIGAVSAATEAPGQIVLSGPMAPGSPVVVAVTTTTRTFLAYVWLDVLLSGTPVELALVPPSVDTPSGSTSVVELDIVQGRLVVTATDVIDDGMPGEEWLFYGLMIGLGVLLLSLSAAAWLNEQAALRSRASTDDLTRLPNRSEFERRVEAAMAHARRHDTGLCVMLIDLDGFKYVNDTRGHQFGDLVLSAAADRLRRAVRDTDLVARWGGDEFVVLMPGVVEGNLARQRAGELSASLTGTPLIGDVSVAASVGVALFPRHGERLDDLMRSADLAMYSAKRAGVRHRMADPVTAEVPLGELLAPPSELLAPPSESMRR